jgi:hypothetical protein
MHEQAQQQLQEQWQQLQAAEEQLTAERHRLAAANGRILRSGIMLRLSLASFLMIVGTAQFLPGQPNAFTPVPLHPFTPVPSALVSPVPSGRNSLLLLLGNPCFWLVLIRIQVMLPSLKCGSRLACH